MEEKKFKIWKNGAAYGLWNQNPDSLIIYLFLNSPGI
jgi:hypothetical protein